MTVIVAPFKLAGGVQPAYQTDRSRERAIREVALPAAWRCALSRSAWESSARIDRWTLACDDRMLAMRAVTSCATAGCTVATTEAAVSTTTQRSTTRRRVIVFDAVATDWGTALRSIFTSGMSIAGGAGRHADPSRGP